MRLIATKPDSPQAPPAVRNEELYWVELARQGQVAAFNQLVLRWEQRIYNLALRMLKDPQEAEDATGSIYSSRIRAEVLSRLALELSEDKKALDEFLASVADLPEPGLKETVVRRYLQQTRSPEQLAAVLGFVEKELQQGEVRRQLEEDLEQKIAAAT